LLNSCSIENEIPDYYFESLPIESVDIPDEFIYGQSHDIIINYYRPTDCHEFNNILVNTDGNQRTVVVLNTVYNTNCQSLIDAANAPYGEVVSATLSLNVNSPETYVFSFYQGKDANEIDQYLVVEVPVIQ